MLLHLLDFKPAPLHLSLCGFSLLLIKADLGDASLSFSSSHDALLLLLVQEAPQLIGFDAPPLPLKGQQLFELLALTVLVDDRGLEPLDLITDSLSLPPFLPLVSLSQVSLGLSLAHRLMHMFLL